MPPKLRNVSALQQNVLHKEAAAAKPRACWTRFDSAVNSATRTVGNQIGSKLVRGILGSLFKGKIKKFQDCAQAKGVSPF